MKKRPTSTVSSSAYAECRECGWTGGRRNAVALAARHHDKTGHVVRVEQTIEVVFG